MNDAEDLEYWRERALCAEDELGAALTHAEALSRETDELRSDLRYAHTCLTNDLFQLTQVRDHLRMSLGSDA